MTFWGKLLVSGAKLLVSGAKLLDSGEKLLDSGAKAFVVVSMVQESKQNKIDTAT